MNYEYLEKHADGSIIATINQMAQLGWEFVSINGNISPERLYFRKNKNSHAFIEYLHKKIQEAIREEPKGMDDDRSYWDGRITAFKSIEQKYLSLNKEEDI